MEFDLLSAPPQSHNLGEAVEMGLSGGEMRQALLDRIREAIKAGKLKQLNRTLNQFSLHLHRNNIVNLNKQQEAICIIDNLLYSLSDEKLNHTRWFFSNETITVLETS